MIFGVKIVFRRFILASLMSLLATASTAAEVPLNGDAFDRYTRGKTLFYGQNGQTYGAEIYMDNQRVRWSFLDGKCKDGSWYEDGPQICFVYEDQPDAPQCWSFSKGEQGLIARFENLPGATELYEADDIGEEMICLGPEVGV